MDGKKLSSFDYANMDSSDHRVSKDEENSINATTSVLNLSDTSTSNSNICIQTLKECCANPSETLKDKEDFIVVDSTLTTAINSTYYNADETNFSLVQKTMAFQTKQKSNSHNYSQAFENILDDESQLEETQNSLCLNRFQKRKKLSNFNSEDFSDNFDITKSNDSEMDSVEERMKSSKLRFSKKSKNQSYSEILDYNLSITKNSTIADDANISKINSVFKKPSNLSLVNYSSSIDTDTSNELNPKFTRQIVEDVGSAFDDVVNNSSVTSNIIENRKETSSSNLSVSYICGLSVHSTIDELNLNQTYDVPPNCNSTRIGSLSQSLKNNREVANSSIEQPINVTYNVENELTSSKSTNNMSLGSVNIKRTLSDTYTVENNLHETFTRQKSVLKSASNTINILTDMSNIISQSELSIRVCNSIHKQQLNKVPQDNIKIHDIDNDTTVNCEVHETDDNNSNRFKLKKKSNGADSNIMSSQGNEVLSDNTNVSNNVFSDTLNISTDTLNHDLSNISLKSNKNMEDLTNTSLTQPSNLILRAANENDLSIPVIHTLPYTSNNSLHFKPKFNFSKQFGHQSLSYHENSMNLTLKNPQNTSLNASLLKIPKNVSNCYNEVSKKLDDNSDSCSLSLKIQEQYPNSQEVLKPLSDSLPFVSNTLSNEVEKEYHTLNTTFNPSQPSDLHFTVKHNPHVNSMIFKDLVDNSLNDNTSLNVTKQVTFKTSKNIPNGYQSAIFDDLITNSQESNSTLTQKKLSNDSELNDLDELSIFANTDELLSNSKSIRHSNSSFEKLDNNCSKTLSLEKQNYSKDELKNFKIECPTENTSKLTTTYLNNKSCDMELTRLKSLSDSDNSEPICLSHETSSEVHNSFSPNTPIHSSNTSNISYCNDKLPLTSNSTELSRKKRKSNEIDGSEISNITQNSLKKNKLTSITGVTRSSFLSVNKDKTLTEQNSMISTNIMNDDSMFLTTSSYITQNSQRENNSTSAPVTKSCSMSDDKEKILTENKSIVSENNVNQVSAHSLGTVETITNSVNENNLTSTRVTRSRSMSVDKNKTLTENNSIVSENNVNQVSLQSPETLKTGANPVNENMINKTENESIFWTTLSSSITEDSQKKNDLTSTRVTRSRSVSVDKSKTLTENKSIVSENNVDQVSLQSPETFKTGANSVNENMINKTEDESIFWTTLSSSITENSQKKNNLTTTRVTRSRSVSVDKSKTLTENKSIVSENNVNQVSAHSLGTVETITNSVNENNLTNTQVTRSRSMSVDKSKTSTENKSIVSENNVNQVSAHSPRTLKTGANSVGENMINKTEDESIFWTTLSSSITEDSQKKNNLTNTQVTRSRSVSVDKSKTLTENKSIVSENNVNQVSAHSLGTVETIANSVIGNNLTNTRVTRSHSMSVDKNKTSTKNNSIVSENNVNQVSAHSPRTLKTGANSVSENMINKTEDESIFWTTLSSSFTEDSQKKKNLTSTRVTRSRSVSVDKSNTLTENKSIVSENNVDQVSTQSPKTLKTGANSVNENMINKTEDESIFWTTLSSSITESSQNKNNVTNTRVTRSRSMSINKRKTLSEPKSVVSENLNQLSVHSLGTLGAGANSVNENMNDMTDDDKSMYWTTLPSESFTNTSATNNVIENENQTPRNKLTLVEHIFNTIGKMSVHKRKSTHPGAFQLDDARQHLVSKRSLHHSPSFITRMLARNNNSESTLSPQSNSLSFVELPQVEETVIKKFKSLYNKESWITKRLYNFLVSKLKPEYNIRSVKYAEKFVKYLASILSQIYQRKEDLQLCSDMLRFHMARYQMINDTADYIQFLTDFIPRPYYDLLVPRWNLEMSPVKFDPTKYYMPIMEDEELLQKVTAYLNEA